MARKSSTVRVGLVGFGYWGPNIARNLDAIETCELSWVYDPSEKARALAGESHPDARITADFDQLLNDPRLDAVVIATPVATHAELAQTVLAADKDCLVEKPLALTASSAEKLVATAERRGLVLMVGHLLEYHPALSRLVEMVRAGELGHPYYAYSQRLNLGQLRADENALWSLGAHDVSAMLALADELPVEVSARGESYVRDSIEDVVFCNLHFPSGLSGHLHLSWLDPHKERRITVVGSKRMATFNDMSTDHKLTVYDKGFDPSHGEVDVYTLRSGESRSPAIWPVEPLRVELDHFVDCVRTGAAPRTDGRSGLRVVQTLEALQRSLELGGQGQALAATATSPT